MNRLVIIGNGFDLAHGLPTGYCDFIDWYWVRMIKETNDKFQIDNSPFHYKDEFIKIQLQFNALYFEYQFQEIRQQFSVVNDFTELNEFIQMYTMSEPEMEHLEFKPRDIVNDCKLEIYNNFFKVINDKKQIQNWVDIENEYYKILKDCLKNQDNSAVKKLNEEFDEIKKLLEKYLIENIEKSYDFSVSKENLNLLDTFKIKNRVKYQNRFVSEFSGNDQEHLNGWVLKYKNVLGKPSRSNELEVQTIFLNFNYTSSVINYVYEMNESQFEDFGKNDVLHIHGRLNDKNNLINFGFGDEMDDDYKTIEKKNDNEYLKNIKSFQYLQNTNYKKMLNFIDTAKFQVYIMGHSCGLSDRILLNKIFEHNNCRSIKVFYHRFDEPKPDGREDNFTEIIQNISRHFNKKELMRERIVPKSLCVPLPQTKLPLKD